MRSSKVILYELNEVPWEIVDRFTTARPQSCLAQVLPRCASFTTINDDDVPLQPWRTWPTFHTSTYTREHNSFDLGQDPATFRGVTMWDAADRSGRRVGVFGALQSWPPKRFGAGGFHVPDTFARTADTEPGSLSSVQAFNLEMTRQNSFAAGSTSPGDLLRGGVAAARSGLRPSTAARLAGHLVREKRDERHRGRRSALQVLLCFDVYWRLHRRSDPHLSIFFTNHVAGMMHRYWGDAVEEYAEGNCYQPDPVYSNFVDRAMADFDRQLATIVRAADGREDTTVVVASSMGQQPIPYRDIDRTYVLDQPERLIEILGLPGAQAGLTMYPRSSMVFPTPEAARAAGERLDTVLVGDRPLFSDARVLGRSLSFQIDFQYGARDLPSTATVVDASTSVPSEVPIAALGVSIKQRPGGGNTAYHSREGILFAYGPRVASSSERAGISVLDAAPSLLEVLAVPLPPSMRGRASIAEPLGC